MQIFTQQHTITRAGLACVALLIADLSQGTEDQRAAARMRQATDCEETLRALVRRSARESDLDFMAAIRLRKLVRA